MLLTTLVVVLFVAAFFLVKRQYSYWEIVGIPNVKAKIPFGNLLSVARKENSFGTALYDIYKQTKEPFIGIYMFFRPALLIRDAELVKNILTKDFQHFPDRGVYCEPETDPMSATLFALPGEAWKSLRAKLTPAFTSGKLKGMFPIVHKVGDELVRYLKPIADRGDSIDIRDLAGRYVLDCIASIIFGQDGISTINDPKHEFRTSGKKISDNSKLSDIFRRSAIFLCPKLLKIFRVKSLPLYMRNFCLNIVTETVEAREKSNFVRKDLMQYLIQLRNNSESKDADDWKINASGKTIKSMSYEEIAAQVFLFYLAGSETSTSTVAYTMYELTQNEDVMYRAHEDIKTTLETHNGELSYEAIMDMKFIDLCVKETLRKFPGLPILNRMCSIDYHIPGTKFTIEKGTPIIVSLLGIHRDEKYFPNPEQYDPDRFSDERRDYNEDMYMPFGAGPRNCIAYRMGLLVAKTAIVTLLMNYKFEALSKRELEFDYGSVDLLPKPGQCKIKITSRN